MDLRLYLRVLLRFWPITFLGLLLAFGLAFLAYVRVDYSEGKVDLTYRASEEWVAYTTLMVSRDGFPWGSAGVPNAQIIPSTVPPPKTTKSTDEESGVEPEGDTYADPSWFSQLAVLYARMADSDPVRNMIEAERPIGQGKVLADAVVSGPNNSVVLPMVQIAGIETTKESAADLSNRAALALKKYIEEQQAASSIPSDQRVQIAVVGEPVKPVLFKGRPMTAPFLVFALGIIGTIGLVFLLENLRPRRVPRSSAPTDPTFDGQPPLPPVPGGPSSGDQRGRALPRRVSVAGAAGALAEATEPATLAPTPLPPRNGDVRTDALSPRRVTRVTGGTVLTNGHGTPDAQASAKDDGEGNGSGHANSGASADATDAAAAGAPRTRPGRSWLWAR